MQKIVPLSATQNITPRHALRYGQPCPSTARISVGDCLQTCLRIGTNQKEKSMNLRRSTIMPTLALAATLAAAITIVSGPAAHAQNQLGGVSADAAVAAQDHTPSNQVAFISPSKCGQRLISSAALMPPLFSGPSAAGGTATDDDPTGCCLIDVGNDGKQLRIPNKTKKECDYLGKSDVIYVKYTWTEGKCPDVKD
jgi:hypothetical protein